MFGRTTLMVVRPLPLVTSTRSTPEPSVACTETSGLSQPMIWSLPATLEISTVPRGSAPTVRSNVPSAAAQVAPAVKSSAVAASCGARMKVSVVISNLLAIGLVHGREHAHLVLIGIDEQLLQ